jgi:EF hand
MKAISVVAAVVLIAGGAAAQTTPDKQPGGNVPSSQSPCTAGFDKTVKDGRMANISADTMKAVDTNNDGRISKTEFDAACTNKLFKEQDSKGG